MSYIGTHFSRFLNTIFNPEVKKQEFLDNINNIYLDLKEGRLSFPTIDFDFEDLLDAVQISNYKMLNKISKKEIVNGQFCKVGYNPILIRTLTNDITLERMLNELSDEQDQLYVYLDLIFNKVNKSLFNFKVFQQLFDDISGLFEVNLFQFQSQDESFCHIMDRKAYFETDYTHVQNTSNNVWTINHNLGVDENISLTTKAYDNDNIEISSKIESIQYPDLNTIELYFDRLYSGTATVQRNYQVYPFLFGVVALFRMYSASTIYYNDLLYDIHTNGILQSSHIHQDFSNYISSNSTEIAQELVTFIYRNVFQFNGDISNHLNIEELSTIKTSLSALPAKFVKSEEDGEIVLETSTYLVYDGTSLTAWWSAVKVMHEILYDRLDEFFEFKNGFNWYSEQEDIVKSNIINHLNSDVELLKMLENISFQFKSEPVFFINSFRVVHGKYSRDLINSLSTGFEVNELKQSMELIAGAEENIIAFIEENYLQRNDDLIKFSAFLKFRDMMNEFIDGEIFTDWLIFNLVPAIKKTVNNHYIVRIEDYKYIDILKSFMKVLFMKHILEEKLFINFTNTFIDKFNEYMLNAVPNLNVDQVSYFANKFLDSNNLTNILNSFYKGSVMSKYTEGVLAAYSL